MQIFTVSRPVTITTFDGQYIVPEITAINYIIVIFRPWTDFFILKNIHTLELKNKWNIIISVNYYQPNKYEPRWNFLGHVELISDFCYKHLLSYRLHTV